MAFPILAIIVRLHLMNYVSLSSIIKTNKTKRRREKKEPDKKRLKKATPPALQIAIEM